MMPAQVIEKVIMMTMIIIIEEIKIEIIQNPLKKVLRNRQRKFIKKL